ncbi:hypothetical protein [Mycobacterium intracellulare]|uniref:hypothetical protein n=1 Tax=Mycobacterium intracellulare TaxID=1767 RepID=UPI000BAF03E7|nr:hypothetical protein [Mycobacterium intracellulare]PBA57187.1 hypothetical protein CKJ57_22450 [Mycobacterium intracellulare subsp. chimaera]
MPRPANTVDRVAGQPALTVILTPGGEADEILAVLADYAAAGLLDPFVSVNASDVDSPSVAATLIREGRSEPVLLQQVLTSDRYERLRIAVLVPVDAPTHLRAPCAAEQKLEQVVHSTSVSTPVTLLRLLFSRGSTGNQGYDPQMVLEGWHNLLVAPEDSAGPGLGVVPLGRLTDPLDVAQHVVPVVASVAGLWKSAGEVVFDDRAILPGRTLRAVRAFYRQLDATGVEDQLRLHLFDADGRLPLPRSGESPAVYIEDVALATQNLARALWTKHRDVLRGGRVEIGAQEQQAISPWGACKIFLSFVWAALRNAPSAWLSGMLGSVSSVLATTVQHAVFGRSDSAYAVVAASELTSWQDVERGAEQMSSMLDGRPEVRHLVQTDLSPLWMDYVNGALTLADGGRRAAGLEPVNVGTRVGVLRNSGDVVPGATDAFTAIHPSLAAVIGTRGVDAGDVFGIADLKDRLQRTFGDPAAGVEARQAFAALSAWEEANANSYAVQVGSILADFLGRARSEVGGLVQRIRESVDTGVMEEELRRRQRVLATVTRTAGWTVLVALLVFLIIAAVGFVGWPFSLVAGALVLAVYFVAALVLFVLGQRHLFAELNRRQTQVSELEAMQFNLRAALQDVSRLSAAYGQLLAWNRVLGELLRAPFGAVAPARPPSSYLVDGLPRSMQIGVAAPAQDAAEAAAHSLQGQLYAVGWLSGPWQRMLESAGRRLRNDESVLFGMPGAGSGSMLDHWSSDVASRTVRPEGAESLWGQVQAMFDDPASGLADALTGGVLNTATDERVSPARFSAGVLENRRGPAAPFDASVFTDAAVTAGKSLVAMDERALDRRGLGYRAIVTQVGDGLPTYDFAMFAPKLASVAVAAEEDSPPESGSLVF